MALVGLPQLQLEPDQMSDVKLFRPSSGIANERRDGAFDAEDPLQTLDKQSPGRSPHSRKPKENPHA